VAFRLGFEQGGQQAQQDQMMQEQQQAQEIQQAAAGGRTTWRRTWRRSWCSWTTWRTAWRELQPGSEHPEGSELDQHIAKLESMIAKAEKSSPDDLKKSFQEFQSLRRGPSQTSEVLERAIGPEKVCMQQSLAIAKALHKPALRWASRPPSTSMRMPNRPSPCNTRIVSDVMAKMEEEEKKGSLVTSALS
jgi:hypothetical protein